MSNYILEGESFFILEKLYELTEGKKIEINPEKINPFSLFGNVDYYVFFDPDKETIESINFNNFILCFMDKNVDLRLDYIKRIKQISTIKTFDPIPTTDFQTLKEIFPKTIFWIYISMKFLMVQTLMAWNRRQKFFFKKALLN